MYEKISISDNDILKYIVFRNYGKLTYVLLCLFVEKIHAILLSGGTLKFSIV